MTTRRSGVLCLHDHAHPSLGWRVELDPDRSNPFQPAEVFVTTAELNRFGITPRHGMRISFVPRSLNEPREPQQQSRPTRLHHGNGIVGHTLGIHAVGNGRGTRAINLEPAQIVRLHAGTGVVGHAKSKKGK